MREKEMQRLFKEVMDNAEPHEYYATLEGVFRVKQHPDYWPSYQAIRRIEARLAK